MSKRITEIDKCDAFNMKKCFIFTTNKDFICMFQIRITFQGVSVSSFILTQKVIRYFLPLELKIRFRNSKSISKPIVQQVLLKNKTWRLFFEWFSLSPPLSCNSQTRTYKICLTSLISFANVVYHKIVLF